MKNVSKHRIERAIVMLNKILADEGKELTTPPTKQAAALGYQTMVDVAMEAGVSMACVRYATKRGFLAPPTMVLEGIQRKFYTAEQAAEIVALVKAKAGKGGTYYWTEEQRTKMQGKKKAAHV